MPNNNSTENIQKSNRIWNIGTIQSFSNKTIYYKGQVKKVGSGLIHNLVSAEEIYFYEKFIESDSKLSEPDNPAHLRNQQVIFQLYISKDGRKEARHICALSEVGEEKLITCLSKKNLEIPQVRSVLFERIPEYYLKDDLLEYILHLHYPVVENLLRKKYETGNFHEISFFESYMKYLNNEKTTADKFIWKSFFLEWLRKESISGKQMVALMSKMKERNLPITDVLSELSVSDLLKNMSECFSILSEEKKIQLLSEIDWTREDKEYTEAYRSLLSMIEADEFPMLSLVIAEKYIQDESLFNLSWWRLLTTSMKIRTIIYYSNEIDNYRNCQERFLTQMAAISRYEDELAKSSTSKEEQLESQLVLAVLYFLKIAYCDEIQKNEKQKMCFLKAAEKLQKYIIDRFNEFTVEPISHGLNILLEQCPISYNMEENTEEFYFCDGRNWQTRERDNVVYCPAGQKRPGNGRCVCRYFSETILETYAMQTQRREYQHLTDFLLNMHFTAFEQRETCQELDLVQENIGCAEYGYRVSAYVNRLLEMKNHMVCEYCGRVMKGNFKYSLAPNASTAITQFNCIENGTEHDHQVYINYCYRCHKVIDSRECKKKYPSEIGQYQCMVCGGNNKLKKGEMCPMCQSTKVGMKSGEFIQCKNPECNYDGEKFWYQSNEKWAKMRAKYN